MKIDRINKIRALLNETETISIDKLCETFGMSKNTIRRDIAELEKQGIIQKIYGGIMLAQKDVPEPFAMREIKNQQAKKQIAQLAASLVNDGDVIYIDSGTTTMHMTKHLAERKNLTILTASVHVINSAFHYPQLNVIATGGTLYRPSNSFVDGVVLDFLRKYNISKAFLSSTGFSIENGVTNASPLECEIKRFLTEKSQTRILLADYSKIGIASLMTFCQLKDIDTLVIDRLPPDNYTSYLKEHNVNLVVPN